MKHNSLSCLVPSDLALEQKENELRLIARERTPDQPVYTTSTWRRHGAAWQDSYERLCRGENDAMTVCTLHVTSSQHSLTSLKHVSMY